MCQKISFALLLCLILLPVFVLWAKAKETDNAKIIKTNKLEGIICTNYKEWEFLFPQDCIFWQPSKKEVLKAETDIEKYLAQSKLPRASRILNKLPEYRRQYIGITVDGHKRIYCNFFYREYHGNNKSPLTEKPVLVDDGGEWFFKIQYDMQEDKCLDLAINGEA